MNECIAFGNWLHDNYYAIQGGWYKRYNPVEYKGLPHTTESLYLIFKPIYDRTRNIGQAP